MLLVPAVQFTSVMVAVGLRGLRRKRGMARAARALGTPPAGLCPRPVREKGFLSNLLLD